MIHALHRMQSVVSYSTCMMHMLHCINVPLLAWHFLTLHLSTEVIIALNKNTCLTLNIKCTKMKRKSHYQSSWYLVLNCIFTNLVSTNVWCVKNELSQFFCIKLFKLFIAVPQNKYNKGWTHTHNKLLLIFTIYNLHN